MTKQELMETYTKEQLVDRIIIFDTFFTSGGFNSLQCGIQSPLEKSMADNYESQIKQKEAKICKLEKERDELKNQRDEQSATIDKLKVDIERKDNEINQIDYILEKLFGVRHDVGKPDEFEKILREKADNYKTVADFIPAEPIKVADILISLEGEYTDELSKICGVSSNETYNIFDISDLRQIAEHLLVYCNANEEKKNNE